MKRSLNCSHSISKNHSFREHEIFNTNNLAILGNNIIIWEPFKHIIINNNPLFDSNKIEHKLRLFFRYLSVNRRPPTSDVSYLPVFVFMLRLTFAQKPLSQKKC